MSYFCAIAASLLLMSAAACSSDPSTPSAPTPPPPTGPSASVVIPTGAATLTNRAYAPAVAEVAVGTTVRWTNSDAVPHTTTADGTLWNSGTVASGGGFSFTFPTAGTFPYHCTIHSSMVGTVVVR